MTPLDALRGATIHAAELLGVTDRGEIAPASWRIWWPIRQSAGGHPGDGSPAVVKGDLLSVSGAAVMRWR